MRNVNLDYTLAVRNLDNTMPDRPNLAKKWPLSAIYQDFMGRGGGAVYDLFSGY